MTRHIMIDIETLATRSDAAIVSIGACTFDPEMGPNERQEDTFLVGVDPEWYDAVKAFTVDPKTVAWWAKQSKDAKDSLKINQVQTLPLAMDRLQGWFDLVGFEKQDWDITQRVWANPPSFDLVILRNAASYAYGHDTEVPWHYRQEMCSRTHMGLFHNLRKAALQNKEAALSDLVKHRADHDAIRQARAVQMIEQERRARKCGT